MDVRPAVSSDDRPHPVQVAAWRRMGGAGRAGLAAELRRKVRMWKREALRTQHTDWTEERIDRELALLYSRGNT